MCSAVKGQQLHLCDSLLLELNVIWDEVGEPDTVRDKMLLELEQECLDVYRRKVDQANRCRAQLRRSIAETEAEPAGICSAIGEPPVHVRQGGGPLASERRRCSGQTHCSLCFSSGSNYSLEICYTGDQSMTLAHDPFYIVKDEIQDSIEKVQDTFNQWKQTPENTGEYVHLTRELLTTCESVQWQGK